MLYILGKHYSAYGSMLGSMSALGSMHTEKCKILHNYFGLNWHLNSYVEVLASSVVVFGDGGLWEIIKLRLGHEHGDLMMGLEPLREEAPRNSPSQPPSLSF